MAAPTGWQRGSWRGLSFATEDQETQGGRRGVQHVFPGGEDPVWEDLGRAAKRFTLNCHITGPDYLAAANAFEDALEAPGPGTLIHPWRGSMQVAVGQYSRRDSAIDGGQALFAVDFLETGLPSVPPPAVDTAAASKSTADDAAAAAKVGLARGFSLAGAADFVETAARDVAQAAAVAVQVRAAIAGGPAGVLGLIDRYAGTLGLSSTLRDATTLGVAVVGLVQTLALVSTTPATVLAALESLLGFGEALVDPVGTTAARDLQRANQAALVQAVNLTASAEAVRAIAAIDFASYDEAVAVRDRIATRLDALALRQADAGDDEGALTYDALRQAMVRDVTARGGSLARVQSYTPANTEPAVVIAHRLYGPVGLDARTADLIARNRIRHPGFVRGGEPLQVLSGADNG